MYRKWKIEELGEEEISEEKLDYQSKFSENWVENGCED